MSQDLFATEELEGYNSAMASPPRLSSFLIYQKTLVEPETKLVTLVGLYEHLVIPEEFPMPFQLEPVNILIKLTDLLGEYSFKLELSNLSTNQILGRVDTPKQTYQDRLEYYDLQFTIRGISLPQFGRYAFELSANENFVDLKMISLQPAPKEVK
jgi:hypothetical protein